MSTGVKSSAYNGRIGVLILLEFEPLSEEEMIGFSAQKEGSVSAEE
jgi:hypothetical protein